MFKHTKTNGLIPDWNMVSDVKRDIEINNCALWHKGQHNQLIRTEAVWNIPDPYTVVPTCHSGRPVQIPTGITSVRRDWAVNVALRLRVRAVANIGREVAHLEDKMYINFHVLYIVFCLFPEGGLTDKGREVQNNRHILTHVLY